VTEKPAKNLPLESTKNRNMATAELRRTYSRIARRMCAATGFAAISDCVRVAPSFQYGDLEPPLVVAIPGFLIVDKGHPAMLDKSIFEIKSSI
jgi:hypothetical protein